MLLPGIVFKNPSGVIRLKPLNAECIDYTLVLTHHADGVFIDYYGENADWLDEKYLLKVFRLCQMETTDRFTTRLPPGDAS